MPERRLERTRRAYTEEELDHYVHVHDFYPLSCVMDCDMFYPMPDAPTYCEDCGEHVDAHSFRALRGIKGEL